MDDRLDKHIVSKILQTRPYRNIQKISSGSYGDVFQMSHENDGKKYAIKVIQKNTLNKQNKMHEAVFQDLVLCKLKHPGIIKHIQTIQTPDFISYVMQLCPFGNLADVFKKVDKDIKSRQMREQIINFYLAQIIDSIDYMHGNNVVHRDLKLQNILLGQDYNCRIIDFGTAHITNKQIVLTKQQLQKIKIPDDKQSSFVGSAYYLAPQSINLNYSFKSDIWAFGVIMYRLIYGKLPFMGQNNFQTFTKIKQLQFDKTLQCSISIPKYVKGLIGQCLQKQPQKRPSATQIKKHPYFSTINFSKVFTIDTPIKDNFFETVRERAISAVQPMDYEIQLQKKMFFGNYKPRILKMYKDSNNEKLLMSYWHLDGKQPKKQFELKFGDFAEIVSQNEFYVVNKDEKYTFRVKDNITLTRTVNLINETIKFHIGKK